MKCDECKSGLVCKYRAEITSFLKKYVDQYKDILNIQKVNILDLVDKLSGTLLDQCERQNKGC